MASNPPLTSLVSSLQANSLADNYSGHLSEALEKAKTNGGVVVVSSISSCNPHIIAIEDNPPISDYGDESSSRDDDFDPLGTAQETEAKRFKLDPAGVYHSGTSIKELLRSIQKAIVQRLDRLDRKMEVVSLRCQCLTGKVDALMADLEKSGIMLPGRSAEPDNKIHEEQGASRSTNLTLITLNNENDYPDGSWLGNENNPEFRVRCPIGLNDLATINRNCTTPEKLALTLLDYLFDRETQACSNISGHGKHGKKQLDPLMIYGIKCHLITKFNIEENTWQRIKQNLDSKCRTAFRRKQKGMPLTVKAFRKKSLICRQSNSSQTQTSPIIEKDQEDDDLENAMELVGDGDDVHYDITGSVVDDATMVTLGGKTQTLVDLVDGHDVEMDLGLTGAGDAITVGIDPQSQIIHTLQGDIQVVHATPEQLAEIQRTGKIQILTSNPFLSNGSSSILNLSTHVPTSGSIDLTTVMPNSCLLDSKMGSPIDEDNDAEVKSSLL